MASFLRSAASNLMQRNVVGRAHDLPRAARMLMRSRHVRNLSTKFNKITSVVDGNKAAADAAYNLSELSLIFPITPASQMSELCDEWAVQGRKNFQGQTVKVTEMQSEGGVAGAVHGALVAGGLATSFSSAQGLLLLVPNMYKIAGEFLPCVFHVAARFLSGQGLSIFSDHGDVMAARAAGWAILAAGSVQEVHDMALVSHIATLKSRIPFLHFFDGMRTSHEMVKIDLVPLEEMTAMVPQKELREFRERALSPINPHLCGTVQGPDVGMQLNERGNALYDVAPGIIEDTFAELAKRTGRHYKPFDYFGAPDAEDVIILMGSGALTAKHAVEHMYEREGRKVGAVQVRMFRPWSVDRLMEALPKSCKRIAVLDRCKEPGAVGEPLYVDVAASFHQAGKDMKVIGGRYGLGTKEFTPSHVDAVFEHLAKEDSKQIFTVGIEDDLTHLSIPVVRELNVIPKDVKQCMFWGVGGDGTVGANQSAITIIGEEAGLNAQGYFEFSAHKTGGLTLSHLRFGESDVNHPYLVSGADYEACHVPAYINKFPLGEQLRNGGTFVMNTPAASVEELDRILPDRVKRRLADRNAQFYTINALKVAKEAGVGKFINQIMQAVFFKLSGVLPEKRAVDLLKESIVKAYQKRSPELVESNKAAVDAALAEGALHKIEIPEAWHHCDPSEPVENTGDVFYDQMMGPCLRLRGNDLPVSAFPLGGKYPSGTTKNEKRGIAVSVPRWDAEKCTECNHCSFVCPHAVIRPYLLNEEEVAARPNLVTSSAKGFDGFRYRLQLSPLDCTGCEVCVHSCADGALTMVPLEEEMGEHENWMDLLELPERGHLADKFTVKGSQFQKPLLEFSGACAGCGETPYIKLITQLYGERMMIANASGCSSVWGGTVNVNPYTKNQRGHGVGWATSLFEDNAEFGFGMHQANEEKRRLLERMVTEVLQDDSEPIVDGLRPMFQEWLKVKNSGDECQSLWLQMEPLLAKQAESTPRLQKIQELRNVFPKVSQWIVGGDGWAYDIGYGGLDHVLAFGDDVNLIVLDNEMYSNTGGQASKSTPKGATGKFILGGKPQQKKDMGLMCMAYNDVYVASVSLSNMGHTLQAIKEAESYPGSSLILAYVPCKMQGVKPSLAFLQEEGKAAVDSGYWPLYRYDPRLSEKGENPFQLDSKKIKTGLQEFLQRDARYVALQSEKPEHAKELHDSLEANINRRHKHYLMLAQGSDGVPQEPSEEDTALTRPIWDPQPCEQCGVCQDECPEGAMHVFRIPAERAELDGAQGVNMIEDAEDGDYMYSIQTDHDKCTACGDCVEACSSRGNCLKLETGEEVVEHIKKGWEFARGIPEWDADLCTQCGNCVEACEYNAIKEFELTEAQAGNLPAGFKTNDQFYSIQISKDCVGCNECVLECEEIEEFDGSALNLTYDVEKQRMIEEHFDFAEKHFT